MNPKIIYGVSNGAYTWSGKRFESLADLETYANAAIVRREKIAGRPLSPQELLTGVKRLEDRDTRQQVYDSAWKPTPVAEQVADDGNPYRSILDQKKREEKLARMSPMEAMLTAKVDQHDAERGDQQEQEAFASDPRRMKAVAHAEDVLERVLFSDSPRSEVVRAQQRLRQVREGDLTTYKVMADEFTSRQEEATAERLEALDEQRAALDAERADLANRFEAEPTPESNVYYPPGYDPESMREFFGAKRKDV